MEELCKTCGHPDEHHKLWAGKGNAYCFAQRKDGTKCDCKDFVKQEESK